MVSVTHSHNSGGKNTGIQGRAALERKQCDSGVWQNRLTATEDAGNEPVNYPSAGLITVVALSAAAGMNTSVSTVFFCPDATVPTGQLRLDSSVSPS